MVVKIKLRGFWIHVLPELEADVFKNKQISNKQIYEYINTQNKIR